MYKLFFAERDNTLYERFPELNAGIDQILELTKIASGSRIDGEVQANTTNTRFLIDFGSQITKISEAIDKGQIPPIGTGENSASVFLNINRPSSNENVRVCVKLREADEDYESLEWYEIKPVTNIEISGNELEFTETEFDYDASELSNSADPNKKEFTGFAVRVILTADNHRIVPTVRDFRAVASFTS